MNYPDRTTALMQAKAHIGQLQEIFLHSDMQFAGMKELLQSLRGVKEVVDKALVGSLIHEIAQQDRRYSCVMSQHWPSVPDHRGEQLTT